MAEKQVAKELIQHNFKPGIAASEIEHLLIPEENLVKRNELSIIQDKLGQVGASNRAAKTVLQFLTNG